MKIDIFNSIIVISISALISFGLYHLSDDSVAPLNLLGIFLSSSLLLLFSIGINYKNRRSGINIRMVSTIFLALLTLNEFLLILMGIPYSLYLVIKGLLLLTSLLIIKSIYTAEK